MKCKIISISHKPSDWEKKALDFYLKQIPNNVKLSFAEVKPFAAKSLSQEEIVRNESLEILHQIDQTAFVILWDRKGDLISSESLAKLFQKKNRPHAECQHDYWWSIWRILRALNESRLGSFGIPFNFSSQAI